MLPPEYIEPITQVCVCGAVQQIDQTSQQVIAEAAQASNIPAATLTKPGSLCEIGTVKEGRDEPRISAASVEPSASTTAMMSPDAAANPQPNAFPFPFRVCITMRASGRSWRTTARVSSAE